MALVGRYFENRDATAITYRKYNQNSNDQYPTYSICFKGEKFHWYRQLTLFNVYGITSSQFEQMLKGQTAYKYQLNYTSLVYNKVPIAVENTSEIGIETVHLQMSDLLVELQFDTENENNSFYYGKDQTRKSNAQPQFNIGYHTPEMICFTRKSTDVLKSVRMQDFLSLNRSILSHGMYKDTEIQIFIHHPGQHWRSFDTPSFKSLFSGYDFEKTLEFKLSQGAILRKRPDSNDPCNKDILNHDRYLQVATSKHIGCIPPYWRQIITDNLDLDECTTQIKLNEANSYIQNYKEILKSFDKPCVEMFVATTYNWQVTQSKDESIIRFIYKDKFYQQIEYVQDFGFESFWSGVGGFVGLFLGYSINQFPEMIGSFSFLFLWIKITILEGIERMQKYF